MKYALLVNLPDSDHFVFNVINTKLLINITSAHKIKHKYVENTTMRSAYHFYSGLPTLTLKNEISPFGDHGILNGSVFSTSLTDMTLGDSLEGLHFSSPNVRLP